MSNPLESNRPFFKVNGVYGDDLVREELPICEARIFSHKFSLKTDCRHLHQLIEKNTLDLHPDKEIHMQVCRYSDGHATPRKISASPVCSSSTQTFKGRKRILEALKKEVCSDENRVKKASTTIEDLLNTMH